MRHPEQSGLGWEHIWKQSSLFCSPIKVYCLPAATDKYTCQMHCVSRKVTWVTGVPPFTEALCPVKPITAWKHHQMKMHLIHQMLYFSVPRGREHLWPLMCSWLTVSIGSLLLSCILTVYPTSCLWPGQRLKFEVQFQVGVVAQLVLA